MSTYSYALIDGVMRQNAIKDVYEFKEAIQLIPLYTGTRFQENYDLGPILVSVLEDSTLISKVQQPAWLESTTILYSNEPPTVVAEHLRQFITVTDETGSHALFRFADPLTTWHWLNSYPENGLLDILGPINKWIVSTPSYPWQTANQPTEFTPNKTLQPTGLTLNYLNEPQTEALDEAAEHRLKAEIYQTCFEIEPNFFQNQSEEKITQWVETRFNQAKQFGAISESSYAMWFVMVMEYGNDFAMNEQGPYQKWLHENSQQKPLPAQVKLQTFFDERPQTDTTVAMEI